MTKKLLLFLFILCVSLKTYAQLPNDVPEIYVKGKIFFKDGTVYTGKFGYADYKDPKFRKSISYRSRILSVREIPDADQKKLMLSKLVFYNDPNKNTKIVKGYLEIEKVREYRNNKRDSIDYHYKTYKNNPIFLRKLYLKGKVDWYLNFIRVPGKISTKLVQEYYLGKNDSKVIEKLPKRTGGKKFKKLLLKYTFKCQPFVEKIEDKGFLSQNEVPIIIKEYSKLCE